MRNRQFAISRFWLLTLPGLIAYGAMVVVDLADGTLRGSNTPITLAWYGLAFAGYLAALIWAEKQRRAPLGVVWGAAIAFRILLLFTTPTLSDDVYRYLWDGHVANNGVSPYAYAIESAELDYLDVPPRELANNPWMASPYLPAAQGLFAVVTRLFPLEPLWLQIIAVIFDLLTAAIISLLLVIAALPQRRIILYLWNPLVIIETAHGAHLDAFMGLLMMLAVWLTLRNRRQAKTNQISRSSLPTVMDGLSRLLAPITLALATLTKIVPVLLMPVLFWHWRWWQTVLFLVVIIAFLAPIGLDVGWGLTGPMNGTGLFGAMRIYADQWNFNSGVFHWLEVQLQNTPAADPNRLAKGITYTAMVVLLVAVWWLAKTRENARPTLRLMAVPLMGYVLLTTTFHPWYLLTLLAFVPFLAPAEDEPGWRWWLVVPWLYLSAAIALSYLTYADPSGYRELEWVRSLEWLPLFALLLVLAWFAWRSRVGARFDKQT